MSLVAAPAWHSKSLKSFGARGDGGEEWNVGTLNPKPWEQNFKLYIGMVIGAEGWG